MSFYHNERPTIFRYQESFQYRGSTLELFLEVSKKEVIEGLYYQWEGESYFQKELSELAKNVEGLKLHEIPLPSESENWSYPFFFYRQFILQIKGEELPLSILKGKDPYELICRCSGVYESDIREHILAQLKNEIYEFDKVVKSLGDELLVSIGCASCKHDMEMIVGEYIQGERTISNAGPSQEKTSLPRWQSLDSQNLASESFTLLKSISAQINIELKLLGTRPGSILIKAANPLDDKQVSSLEEAFSDALGTGLDLQIK